MKFSRVWENLRDVKDIKLVLFTYPKSGLGITLDEFYNNESQWRVFLIRFSEKFNLEYISKMIKKTLADRMEFIRNKRASVYNINDMKRDRGVSFAERKDTLDRIPVLAEMESEVKSYYGRKIRPIEDWLTIDDVRSMRRLGMDMFFRINFRQMIYD